MKTRLFSILALLACAFCAYAVEESVDFTAQGYTNQQSVTAYTGTEFSVTFAQGNNNLNAPLYFNNSSSTSVRLYAMNTFTVASRSASNITDIVITYEEKNEDNPISASVGTFTDNQKVSKTLYTGTWAGNAASVTFTVGGTSGNRRITKMKVTVEGGGSLGAIDPTLTFNNGKVVVGKTLDLASLFSSNSQGAVTYSITAGDSYATISGSVLTGVAEGSVTVKAEQAAVEGVWNAAEATATVTVSPAPAGWAVTYTSNISLSAATGTSVSSAKVVIDGVEYDALKCGISSTAGVVRLTVPSGTEVLHMHIAGWKEENVTVGINAGNVTVDQASVTLVADNGITGNSPFTLAGEPGEDHYFALTLTRVTAETEITFSATSGKRFVVYGVNAVHGNQQPDDPVDPTVTFSDGEVYIGATLDLSSLFTSNSQGAVTYNITAGGEYASLSGSVLTGIAAGSVTVEASQAAEGHYNAFVTTAAVNVTAAPVISDYSTLYTSNVTLSTTGGTKASEAAVVIGGTSYGALKAGTSSAAGAVVITVPAGTCTLHLHAASWNSESVTLTVTGANVSPSSLALKKDSGVANNSPFTLAGNTSTDQYFKLTLSDVTAPADLTFTATTGKRFVIYGVNAVIAQPTALDSLQGDNGTQAVKVLRNGVLYIVRDGMTYTVQGQLLR